MFSWLFKLVTGKWSGMGCDSSCWLMLAGLGRLADPAADHPAAVAIGMILGDHMLRLRAPLKAAG